MLTPEDKDLLVKKGISEQQIAEQLACFEKGFPFLKLDAAASVEKGIMAPAENEMKNYLEAWDTYKEGEKTIVKFVPASGAASRMFKNLFEFLGADYNTPKTDFEKKFFDHIHSFAFYNDLNAACMDNTGKDIDALMAGKEYKPIVANLLEAAGLNYGALPKGLLKFHRYADGVRTPLEEQECWQVYSIVTDMYMPNPKRLRDWLSVPKSNGYESLHTTVMGPEGKWVEVQIRTERMDEIAERGLAAHWRYKGVKGESGLDEWLTSIRETLENADSDLEVMDQFKLELYEDEVFVFTPKGDLYKMPKGATVLDFAFAIHSKLGSKCIGAKVNGKNAQLKQTLNSGDQVEVMTSNTQTPKRDWLNIVTTSKARTKIRQAIKEIEARQTEFAKETIERKFKNRKLEYDEAVMMRLIKKLGYKTVTEFYQDIANETRDANDIIEKYLELKKKETENREDIVYRSAENFSMQTAQDDKTFKEDVLVIDQNLKGLDFKLAKCCNPIYGDDVFGFVTISGGIKIHRTDCPNARELQSRFAYRIVKARWAGKSHGKQYPITLRIVGHDDIGIVTNITSIINKENDILLRSISIDSHDGLFSGMMTVMVDDTSKLESLVKKIKTVKGVKQVNRG
jgi:GTP diphosphokinase / guanosine-3',5'-bis(diphosphate) 3'-diphosphatase